MAHTTGTIPQPQHRAHPYPLRGGTPLLNAAQPSRRPAPPPTGPKTKDSARAWQRYYERRAAWFTSHSQALEADYPFSAALAADEAKRFAQGAEQLRNGTHPNQLCGIWS